MIFKYSSRQSKTTNVACGGYSCHRRISITLIKTCTELVFVVSFKVFKGTSHLERFAVCITVQGFTVSPHLLYEYIGGMVCTVGAEMGRGNIPQLRGSQGTEESLQRIFQQQRQEHQDQHRDCSLYEHFFGLVRHKHRTELKSLIQGSGISGNGVMEGGVSKSSQVSPSFFVSRDESTAGGPHNNKV